MNKQDIANIRKQFKLDNYRLKIQEIYNVYVKKESGEIYHDVSQPFEFLEKEEKELFLANFKKVLTGELDRKLFELKFTNDRENETQLSLFHSLHAGTDDWKESMLSLVEKIYAKFTYEFDTMVTFIRGEYLKPTKARDKESEEGGDDEVYSHSFILCSINKTVQPKKALIFDYIERLFKPNNSIDPVINLQAPLTGFMFPAFNEDSIDVNHLLYCSGKVNQPDYQFIEDVLECEEIITAQDDKEIFGEVVRKVVGDQVDTEMISNVYEEIEKIVQENEEPEAPKLDYRDVERILTASGVENVDAQKVEFALKDVLSDEKHEFKATSLVPKKIKIKTTVADLSIQPKDLKNVKYIDFQGKRCLLLEIDEDVEIEGFRLEKVTF